MSFQEIKKRGRTLSTMKQMTSSLQLITSLKKRKIQSLSNNIEEYYTQIKTMLPECEYINSLYFTKKKKYKNYVYIAIGSDKGLCGAFNINLVKILMQNKGKMTHILCSGKKLFSILKNKFNNVTYFSSQGVELAKEIFAYCKNLLQKDDTEVIMIQQNVISTSLLITKKNIFPYIINQNVCSNSLKDVSDEQIMKKIIPIFFTAYINKLILSNNLAENTSRIITMDNAKRHLDIAITNNNISINRIRQNKITTEMVEIISAL